MGWSCARKSFFQKTLEAARGAFWRVEQGVGGRRLDSGWGRRNDAWGAAGRLLAAGRCRPGQDWMPVSTGMPGVGGGGCGAGFWGTRARRPGSPVGGPGPAGARFGGFFGGRVGEVSGPVRPAGRDPSAGSGQLPSAASGQALNTGRAQDRDFDKLGYERERGERGGGRRGGGVDVRGSTEPVLSLAEGLTTNGGAGRWFDRLTANGRDGGRNRANQAAGRRGTNGGRVARA